MAGFRQRVKPVVCLVHAERLIRRVSHPACLSQPVPTETVVTTAPATDWWFCSDSADWVAAGIVVRRLLADLPE